MNAVRRDLRETEAYRLAEAFYAAIQRPGRGAISDASEVHGSPCGRQAVFTAQVFAESADVPASDVAHIDLDSGETQLLTDGPSNDRLPKFSPDGRRVAFLSDRQAERDFQLHLINPVTGAVQATPRVEGWVEYFHWSPTGDSILLGVADHGADVAGAHGAVASNARESDMPAWMPTIDAGDGGRGWRQAWIYRLADDAVAPVGGGDHNVWEAMWCGDRAIVAVVSPGPGEGRWYDATLALLDLELGGWRGVFTPQDQVGWPAGSPDGRRIAVVEAVCSDRWIVSGELRMIDVATGAVQSPATGGMDVSHVEWRSDRHLLIAGQRGFDTVVGLLDVQTGGFSEVWASDEIGTSGRLAVVSGVGPAGDCVLIGEGFAQAPEIAMIRCGAYCAVRSLDPGYAERVAGMTVERVDWRAPDGLDLQGWLVRPPGPGPYPMVMNIHGGPVLHWRPMWLGRSRYVPLCLLVARGHAVFLPNPRGSSGRGRDFARQVAGDMGGMDAIDLLSGLDHLVAARLADPKRLGVTGVSYGGFMSAWLVTQDQRFAAAVPIAPITNFMTEHLLSNIPDFVRLFLNDSIANPGGEYFRRSPALHAGAVVTPTLSICGALDRCTPPAEAKQFHAALTEHGVESALACYPGEGHGIHGFPAAIDFAARVVDWFDRFMPSAFHSSQDRI